MYGGETERARTEEFVRAAATQARETNTYLNPYQKRLAEMLDAKQIDAGRFAEETGAIMAELRFTNPEKLHQVQDSQQRALERLRGRGVRGTSTALSIQ